MQSVKRHKDKPNKKQHRSMATRILSKVSRPGYQPPIVVTYQENNMDKDLKKLKKLETTLAEIEARVKKLEKKKSKCSKHTTSGKEIRVKQVKFDKKNVLSNHPKYISSTLVNGRPKNDTPNYLSEKISNFNITYKRNGVCECLSRIIYGRKSNNKVRKCDSDTTISRNRHRSCCHRHRAYKRNKSTNERHRCGSGQRKGSSVKKEEKINVAEQHLDSPNKSISFENSLKDDNATKKEDPSSNDQGCDIESTPQNETEKISKEKSTDSEPIETNIYYKQPKCLNEKEAAEAQDIQETFKNDRSVQSNAETCVWHKSAKLKGHQNKQYPVTKKNNKEDLKTAENKNTIYLIRKPGAVPRSKTYKR